MHSHGLRGNLREAKTPSGIYRSVEKAHPEIIQSLTAPVLRTP